MEINNSRESLINKYGNTFIVYANLWEVERRLSASELIIAKQIRHESCASH